MAYRPIIVNAYLGADAVTTDKVDDGTLVAADFATDPYARANHTGTQLAATISDFNSAAVSAVTPTIEASIDGLDYKSEGVRAASVADVTIATAPAAIDGVTLAGGDRVLLKDQTLPEENGIYDFNGAGNPLTRSADANTSAEVTNGVTVWVGPEGTANDSTRYTLTTADPIVLNTTSLTFTQTGGTTPVPVNLNDLADVDTTGVVDGALVRYEGTGTVWNDTSALLFTDANQLRVLSDASTGGLVLGALGDVNLYRDSNGFLATDDTLFTNGGLGFIAGSSSSLGFLRSGTGTVSAFIATQTGDTQNRFDVNTDGLIKWGTGAVAADTNLYRSAANTLKTDDSFLAELNITAQDGNAGQARIGDVGPGSEPGIAFGSSLDTSLYRDGASTLRTDDDFIAAASLTVSGTAVAGARFISNGGQRLRTVTTTAATYALDATSDYIVLASSSANAVAVELPASHDNGTVFVVKNIDNTNGVTITTNDADTIDGAASVTVLLNESYKVVSNGTNWFLIT